MPRSCCARRGSTWNVLPNNPDSVRRVSCAAPGKGFTKGHHAKLDVTHTPRALDHEHSQAWRLNRQRNRTAADSRQHAHALDAQSALRSHPATDFGVEALAPAGFFIIGSFAVRSLLQLALPDVETSAVHSQFPGQPADVIAQFHPPTARSRNSNEYRFCLPIDALHSLKSVELYAVSFWGRSPDCAATKSTTVVWGEPLR